MAHIKIGDKLLVDSSRLFIPEGDEAEIQFLLPQSENPLAVKIRFIVDDEGEKKGSVTVNGSGQSAVITFKNWNSLMGATMQKQLSFAESQDGDEVYFIASARKRGKVYCLDIQFLLKAVDEELATADEDGLEINKND